MSTTESIEVHASSGNVFEDLGLSDPELLLVKATCAGQIVVTVRERSLSTKRLGKILGLELHAVSDLLSGRLSNFTLETLAGYVALLGAATAGKGSSAHHRENVA